MFASGGCNDCHELCLTSYSYRVNDAVFLCVCMRVSMCVFMCVRGNLFVGTQLEVQMNS